MTLFFAMLIDAAVGEPKMIWSRIPHPAVLMGKVIGWLDKDMNKGDFRLVRGVICMFVLAVGAILLGMLIAAIPTRIADVVVLAVLLAQRSLFDHVRDVAQALKSSIKDGRRAVAKIVGRDTAEMTESQVCRAAIESAAENLSDGVIAPIFWFVVGGIPGLLLYKVTNTADSMIGYKTIKYKGFGWAAARFDDALNLIPARLSAFLILLAAWQFEQLNGVIEDAPKHRSPNAGWPEAAMAYGLNIALSGPRSYDGNVTTDPYVNENGIKELNPTHITEAIAVLWSVWGIVLVHAGVLGFLLG